MDNIIEKSVELGVKTFTPFVSDFSFIRKVGHEKLKNKSKRWQKIIQSATQQSGRGELMELAETTDLVGLLNKFNQLKGVVGLFPYEGKSSQGIKQALKGLSTDEIWVFVGSEGGYSDKEVELFQQFGLKSTTLGDQVLRVETACLALLSIIKYELADN